MTDAFEYLTVEQPLGPFRHEVLSENVFASSAILADVGPFHEVFTKGSKIIIGRRGSGKTAVIMGYNSLAAYGRNSGKLDQTRRTQNLRISLSDFGQMHDMMFSVAKRVQETFGNLEDSFASAEHMNEYWTDEIWLIVFKCLYGEYKRNETYASLNRSVPALIEWFEGGSASGKLEDILITQDKLSEVARKQILDHLHKKGEIFILIDSMEEFPIRSPMFQKLAKGFLKSVHSFNQKNSDINIILCIPDELERFFSEYSSNIVKDFADAIKLNWNPSEILKVISHRYRAFLVDHTSHVPDFTKIIEGLDFSIRDDMRTFFGLVMQDNIKNSLGIEETSLAYLIRHTQLLPREFIIIFNRAIKNSLIQTRSTSFIIDKSIVSAVEESEELLVSNILAPYKTIYPKLLAACDNILPNMSPICSNSDLDKVSSQFKGRIEDDIVDPWRTLFEIGVLGEAQRENGKIVETDRYIYANFKFNSANQINFSNDSMFCFHPLFSKKWGMAHNRAGNLKLVYPASVGEDWEGII